MSAAGRKRISEVCQDDAGGAEEEGPYCPPYERGTRQASVRGGRRRSKKVEFQHETCAAVVGAEQKCDNQHSGSSHCYSLAAMSAQELSCDKYV